MTFTAPVTTAASSVKGSSGRVNECYRLFSTVWYGDRRSFHRCCKKPICKRPSRSNGSVPAQRTSPPNAADTRHDSAQREVSSTSKYPKQQWIVIREVMELGKYDCRNGEHTGDGGKNKTNQRQDRRYRPQFWP